MATNQNSRRNNPSLSTDNSSFRLVAVRPYSGSSTDALKALHRDTTYFLVGDYKDKYENGKWVGIEKSSGVPLPHDFFSVEVLDENKHPLKMPFVNISAIVGKNGCGKSSLIEFLIQLITNFYFEHKETLFSDIMKAGNAYGRVYYEINNHLQYIDYPTSKLEDGEMKVKFSDNSNFNEIIGKDFFYSIVSNYSLYAYNCKDNDKTWFNDLFNKNDRYQMPVVITPMRNKGNIDINIENDLAKNRLLSIFSQTKLPTIKRINGEKKAIGLGMTQTSSSTLTSYIKGKFEIDRFRYIGFQTRINDFTNYIDLIKKKQDTNGFFSRDEFRHEIQFWTRFDKNFWTKYIGLIDHANSIAKKQIPDEYNNGQMYEYFNLLATILKHRDLDSDNVVKESIEFIKGHCKFINALQFQRLMMIIYICDLWDKKKIFDSSAFGQAFSDLDEHHESTDTKVQAYWYVIYETIVIFETYIPFNLIFDFSLKGFVLFDGMYEDGSSFTNNLDECFNRLFDKNSEIYTNYKFLKLRQTLNFLTIEGLADEYISFKNVSPIPDMPYYFSFDELHDIREKYSNQVQGDTLSLLPPPIFSTDILVKENSETFMLSSMSSGELQMLYSIGALIYHLQNLDYISNDNYIQYKYVSIVLEEVEQYFHPEYQQDYVHTLLTYIANACLKNIKGINILLVTHSPFVLSDIPKQNVLFLKEGMPTYSMQQNTFGANIHSMLQNGFFLNGLPIGEFAKEKINELTQKLHNGAHAVDNKDNDEIILNMINLIGEPIVKSQLLKMYSDYKLPYIYENQIKKLEAKIAKLEKKYDKD